MAIPAAPEAPMGEINMTPLIDVMLVLLVMFIITIPLQTHAVKLDLPVDCTICPQVDTLQNKITITNNGEIRWNGTAVSKQELAYTLDRVARMSPQPELHLQPEAEARYELVDEVFAITKRARIRRMGFIGNEAYRTF